MGVGGAGGGGGEGGEGCERVSAWWGVCLVSCWLEGGEMLPMRNGEFIPQRAEARAGGAE